MKSVTKHAQRGSASLIVVMVLLFSMALVVAYANRSLLFEQRTSINQYRATQAFEAAEAGLEWAQAMLNDPRGIDTACVPSTGASSLRQRWLQFDAARQRHMPLTWNDGGVAVSLRAACARTATGWSCSCPATGHPVLAAQAATTDGPAFIVHAEAVDRAGTVRLVATGCTALASPCAPSGSSEAEATARVQALFGLVPGMASLPTAPLTAKGDIAVGSAAIGLHNPDAATGGIVAHAGAHILAPAARIGTVPGGSAARALVQHDAALAATAADWLFAAFFGLDKAMWAAQPVVRRLRCNGDCSAALSALVSGVAGPALVWIDGDVALAGPLTLGTPTRPIIVASSGNARLSGAIALHGVLYAAGIEWNGTSTGRALVRGAFISEGHYSGNGTADLFYDAPVLHTLQRESGSLVRLPGSWKDF